jgi:hypothetical protein
MKKSRLAPLIEGLVIKGELAMVAIPFGSPPAQLTHDPQPTPPGPPLSTAVEF